MKNYKLSRELKRKMELELRQYEDNKKILNDLKKDNKSSTRRYLYIEQRLKYVENTYNRLKTFEQEVYNLIFKENCDALYVETHKHISKTTYYNIFNKSIFFLAEEWGEI